MQGAVLIRRKVRKGYEAVMRHDLKKLMRLYADNAVLEFPSQIAERGRFEGKEAIREYFRGWFSHMPEVRFTLHHIGVQDIFAFRGTNVVFVEWSLEETDTDGTTYSFSGVSRFRLEDHKVVHVKEYVFDQQVLASVWTTRRAVPVG